MQTRNFGIVPILICPCVIIIIIKKLDYDELLADFKMLQDDSIFNAVLITKVNTLLSCLNPLGVMN